MLDLALRMHFKQLDKLRSERLLAARVSLHKIDHHNARVIVDEVSHVPLEGLTCEHVAALDRYDWLEALLLLLPKYRYTATYLDETVQVVLIGDNDLGLDKVRHV